jgi:hypothetical protein
MSDQPSDSHSGSDDTSSVSVMVATVSTIRIGRVIGPPSWWRFEPVPPGGYALVWPCEQQEHSVLRGARVGEDGLLYELELDDRSSRESSLKMYLEAPRAYLLWWTLDEELYARALEEPDVVRAESVRIRVEQCAWSDRAPLREQIEELDKLDPEHFEERDDVRHTICHHLLHHHVFYEGRSAPIFDVTPAPLRALYTVELMEWFMLRATRAAAKDLATLEHAAAMIRAAEKGFKDAALEHEAAQLFNGAESWRVFEGFREYAWRCAATGVGQTQYRRSIAMHEGPSDLPQGGTPESSDGGIPPAPEGDWLGAALDIRDVTRGVANGPAVHPYLRNVTGPSRGFVREGPTLTPAQQELLIQYFDAYRFGASLRGSRIDDTSGFAPGDDYAARMASRLADWSEVKSQLLADARALLEREARCDRLVLAVARACADDPDLLGRYVHAAAFCEAPWWSGLSEAERAEPPRSQLDGSYASAAWPFWRRFKLWVKPLAEGAGGAGKLSKMLKERLGAYQLAAREVQRMLDSIARLELTLQGAEVDATRDLIRSERAHVRVGPSGGEGSVRISLQSAERKPGAPREVLLRFVRKASDGSLPGARYEPAQIAGEFELLLPARSADLAQAQRFTAPFSALADAVNLAIALTTVCGEARAKERALATFDLAKNVIGLVSSLPTALVALDAQNETSPFVARASAASRTLADAAKVLGRADAAIKLYKGLEVLLRDESPAAFEARQGRTFRASAQRLNDVANVVVGLGAAIELTGAAFQAAGVAELLGLSSALVAGFSATPWGLLLCVGGAVLVAGSALAFDLAQPWELRLMQLEQLLAQACRSQVSETRFRAALQLAELRTGIHEAWRGATH